MKKWTLWIVCFLDGNEQFIGSFVGFKQTCEYSSEFEGSCCEGIYLRIASRLLH